MLRLILFLGCCHGSDFDLVSVGEPGLPRCFKLNALSILYDPGISLLIMLIIIKVFFYTCIYWRFKPFHLMYKATLSMLWPAWGCVHNVNGEMSLSGIQP